MAIFTHELRRGRAALLIWSGAIALMLASCIMIYPEMSAQTGDISRMFADMGSFTRAFGMDRLNFGKFIGFFGIECGNVLGLGGAFFAALIGISALSREEKERTAEFLLTHPVPRATIIAQKLLAALAQVTFLNISVIAVTTLSVCYIGETPDARSIALILLAYYLMQLEILGITFCISAFLRRGGAGIGLGFAAVMYFLNIIANLVDKARFLKIITPFGYTESADIIADQALNIEYLCVGMMFAIISVALAFFEYIRKDIA